MTVELYRPNANAPAGAHLTYRGGPLLQNAKLFGVFVDDPNGSPFAYPAEMSAYLDWYGSSDLIKELAEYNIQGPASHIGDAKIPLGGGTPPPPPPPPPGPPPPPPPPPVQCPPGCVPEHHKKHHHHAGPLGVAAYGTSLDLPHRHRLAGTVIQDSDIQNLLSQAIAAGSLPKPDSSLLYVMFFPDGVTIQLGQDASCSTFCGYHSDFTLSDGSYVYYAVLPFPSCSGCLGGMSALDSLTTITSHEISEAITDPVPGSGWYDDQNGEVGDICAWNERRDGQYEVQLEWSNAANACI